MRLKKIFFKMIGVIAFFAFLFSCRGIILNNLIGQVDSSVSDRHVGCCAILGKNGLLDAVHYDFVWGLNLQKNTAYPLAILGIFLGGIGLAMAVITCNKYNLYIQAIRRQYGSFSFLNYFTLLFSSGILHAKVF